MRKGLKKILYIGESHQGGEDHLRRLVILNVLFSAALCLSILFLVLYLSFGYYTHIHLPIATIVLFTAYFYLNHYGKVQLSRYLSIFTGNILIFLSYQLTRGALDTDRFFMIIIAAPLVLFPLDHKKDIVISSCVSLLFVLITPWVPYLFSDGIETLSASVILYLSIMVDFSSALFSLLPPALLFYLTEDYFRKAEHSKHQELQSSRMAALGEMSAGVAHEINNPLSVIAGRAEQLQEMGLSGSLNPDMMSKAAESISKNTHRITSIVKSLKTFARGGQEDPFVWSKVEGIFDETLELCQERMTFHDITVQRDIDDLKVFCNTSQVMQVLINILNNAIDALESAETPQKTIKISSYKHEGHTVIQVSNNGPPIPSQLLKKITEPFFTTKGVGKGTGLGLSISKEIMQRHRGLIRLTSDEDWTSFSLLFPAEETTSPPEDLYHEEQIAASQ